MVIPNWGFRNLYVFLVGLTPLQYRVESSLWGVPEQYYPEIFWLLFGLPISFVILMVGSTYVVATKIRK